MNRNHFSPAINFGASLADKRFLITGASRGIGYASAEYLARAGARVWGTYLNTPPEHIALRDQFPHEVNFTRLDVRDDGQVKQVIADFIEQEGRIDGLINNAGIGGIPELLVKMSFARIMDTINVNLVGAIRCTKVALRHMARQRSGSIINVSSVAAARSTPGQAHYAASKGGLESFTHSLAAEYGKRGIRANCIRLGPVETDMYRALPQVFRDSMTEMMPAGGVGTSDEVSGLVAYLLSDDARYISGTTITADGGYLQL